MPRARIWLLLGLAVFLVTAGAAGLVKTGAEGFEPVAGRNSRILDLGAASVVTTSIVGTGRANYLSGSGELDTLKRATTLVAYDIDGDGYQDIAVRAQVLREGSDTERDGAVLIFFGSNELKGSLDVSSAAIRILGPPSNGRFGYAIAARKGEIFVGDPAEGAVYGFKISRDTTSGVCQDISIDSAYIKFIGPDPVGQFGSSIAISSPVQEGSDAGLIIGAPGTGNDAGAAYFFRGKNIFDGTDSTPKVIDLTAGEQPDLTIRGFGKSLLGSSLIFADIKGDGNPYIICAAPAADKITSEGLVPQTGAIYGIILKGDAANQVDIGLNQQDFDYYGSAQGDHFGYSIGFADVLGSGIPQLLAGAPDALNRRGQTYILTLGPVIATGSIDLAITRDQAIVIDGNDEDRLGASVIGGLDKKSGSLSLLAGRPGASDGKGAVSVFLGGSRLSRFIGTNINYDQADYTLEADRAEGVGDTIASLRMNDASYLVVAAPLAASDNEAKAGKVMLVADTAIIANAVGPYVHVTKPNGGEKWFVGDTGVITWYQYQGDAAIKKFQILLSTDGGTTFGYTIIDNYGPTGTPYTDITYNWTVLAAFVTPIAKIRVIATDNNGLTFSDDSDFIFTIANHQAPNVTVTSPNGGEHWNIGDSKQITWSATDADGDATITKFQIWLSTDSGTTYPYLIVDSVSGAARSYVWTIAIDFIAPNAKVKVIATDNTLLSGMDESDSPFSITWKPTTLHVDTPNGGEHWNIGATNNITWTVNAPAGDSSLKKFQIWLSTDAGATYSYMIVDNLPGSSRTYPWQILLGFVTPNAKIKVIVTDNFDVSTSDESDNRFSIEDPGVTVTLLTPNGGLRLYSGTTTTISWSVTGIDASRVSSFDLLLSTDGGTTFNQTIVTSLGSNVRSFAWTISPMCVTQGRVRVVSTSLTGIRSSSDSAANFFISTPGPTLDPQRLYVADDIGRLRLFAGPPIGSMEVLFNEGCLIEISTDETGSSFQTFSKLPRIKQAGRLLITKGAINNQDVRDFFPNGATRVVRITNPPCGTTIVRIRRFNYDLAIMQ